MTHAEGTGVSVGRIPAGIFPSECPGQLIEVGNYRDRYIAYDLVCERTITVWRCVLCEGRISVDLDAHVILNHYQGPTLSPDAVLGLAATRANGEGGAR
jgi:hypothetical protein